MYKFEKRNDDDDDDHDSEMNEPLSTPYESMESKSSSFLFSNLYHGKKTTYTSIIIPVGEISEIALIF